MNSLKIRFIVVFGLFTLISCGAICGIATYSIFKTGETLATEQGIPVCAKAAQIIDGDEFAEFLKNPTEEDPYYETTRLALLDVKTSAGCTYLYTMVPKEGSIYEYIIDGSCDPSDEENFSCLGDEEDVDGLGPAPVKAMKEGVVTSSGLVGQDNWGWQISTYHPIKTSSGKIIGLIGCDFEIGLIMKVMRTQIQRLVILSILFVIFDCFLVWAFTRMLFSKIKVVSTAMKDIAEGKADLTVRIPEKGKNELSELARNSNSVIQKLSDLVKELQMETAILSESGNHLHRQMEKHLSNIGVTSTDVSKISDHVINQSERIEKIAGAVRNVDSEISGLDKRLTSQSEAILQSTTAVEEISSNIHSVDHNVNLILAEYDKLVEEAEKGRKKQDQVSEQIGHIAKQSENLTVANAAINAIASKTNLLAMNAAIEAAHAGEAGKGFAVVASEIRELATTSAKQSDSIRSLLDGISEAITGIVESSTQSAKAFVNVNQKINELENFLKEVQVGMHEESLGVDNILQSMKMLDDITHDITSASANMKSDSGNAFKSIQELLEMAEETHSEANSVAGSVSDMKIFAEEAASASDMSREAAQKVSDMINGFKV